MKEGYFIVAGGYGELETEAPPLGLCDTALTGVLMCPVIVPLSWKPKHTPQTLLDWEGVNPIYLLLMIFGIGTFMFSALL